MKIYLGGVKTSPNINADVLRSNRENTYKLKKCFSIIMVLFVVVNQAYKPKASLENDFAASISPESFIFIILC